VGFALVATDPRLGVVTVSACWGNDWRGGEYTNEVGTSAVADGITVFAVMGDGEISLICRLVSLGRRLNGDQSSCDAVSTWPGAFEVKVAGWNEDSIGGGSIST